MPSIRFAGHSLAGNIGAPLGGEDSTWLSGAADDVANERGEQYEEADEPFRARLCLEDSEDGEMANDAMSTVE